MTMIIHINGWPGTGKLSIARLLGAQLSGRVIDNHSLLNPADCLYFRTDPNHSQTRKIIRSLVIDLAARLPAQIPIVFTDAFSDSGYEHELFEDYRGLAQRRGAHLIPVVLTCDQGENMRRLVSPGRSEQRKMIDPEQLAHARASYRLLYDDGSVELDVSHLSAADAASTLHRVIMRDNLLHPHSNATTITELNPGQQAPC
jgi:hypothetical protein